MGKGGSAPAPTPAGDTAAADFGAKTAAAGFAMQHGTPDQFSPGGSVTYDKYDLPDATLGNGKTVAGGQGIQNVFTSFNPEFQSIFDTLTGKGQGMAGQLPTEFNPNISSEALRQSYIDQGTRAVEPVWQREDDQRKVLMAERGIPLGSEIDNGIAQQTGKARSDYMLNLTDQAHQAAGADEARQFQQAVATNQMPWTNFSNFYNSIQGMLAGLQGQNNPLIPAQAPNVDVAGITKAFNDAQQRQFANNQGAGAGIGAALSGLGGLFGSLSDVRAKTDIRPVGKLTKAAGGHTIHSFKYKTDPAGKTHLGLLAQEVERTHPEAVRVGPSGLKRVDYAVATRPSLGKHLRMSARAA